MKFLNLGCGGQRVVDDQWINIDDLYWQLIPGSAARANLDGEPNYINFEIGTAPLPFPENTFDGILASHLLEHMDAQQGVSMMIDCLRILKPGGILYISVPDASYFRKVYAEDRNENWPRLFEVTDPQNPIPTFFHAALWFEQHKAILTADALWCYFKRAGFEIAEQVDAAVLGPIATLLNRRILSLEMIGVKPL